jgi:adenylylsulfate kinase
MEPNTDTSGRPGGFVVWLTGLSSAGKTTVSLLVEEALEREGFVVERLDGDIVRQHLCADLGFSKEDRDTNVERIGWVASRLARAGAAVLVAVISPYEEARRRVRALVEEHAPFVCVHVATSVEECSRRDAKGLYQRAFAGEIQHFTGVDDPYEIPLDPEILLDTEGVSPTASADILIERLQELGVIAGVGAHRARAKR